MKKIIVRHIAKNQNDTDPSGKFIIRRVGDLTGGKDLIQELHRHDFFFILTLQTGKGSHEIDFQKYEIVDNSVFFMRPGQVHQLTLKAGSTGYLIEFNTEFYHPDNSLSRQQLQKAGNQNFCVPDTGSSGKIQSILNYIFGEYTERQQGYQEIIRANMDILFIELIRQSRDNNIRQVGSDEYAQARLEEFLELLEIHATHLKQASQYARLMSLSLYQLNSITKATVGKTSSELINGRIILEAKRYLLATSGQIKDIAFHLGYEDVSYFIRFFKKHAGYAPEVFRKKFG